MVGVTKKGVDVKVEGSEVGRNVTVIAGLFQATREVEAEVVEVGDVLKGVADAWIVDGDVRGPTSPLSSLQSAHVSDAASVGLSEGKTVQANKRVSAQ